ncbi:hypothetical protein BDW74DRAFT_174732 [Aspergillus multicolor]|uniref:uncharacterized protein n=1 Tax=Aspergillus multicolor TaxID=41759 RepID=UPI003CCD92C7
MPLAIESTSDSILPQDQDQDQGPPNQYGTLLSSLRITPAEHNLLQGLLGDAESRGMDMGMDLDCEKNDTIDHANDALTPGAKRQLERHSITPVGDGPTVLDTGPEAEIEIETHPRSHSTIDPSLTSRNGKSDRDWDRRAKRKHTTTEAGAGSTNTREQEPPMLPVPLGMGILVEIADIQRAWEDWNKA